MKKCFFLVLLYSISFFSQHNDLKKTVKLSDSLEHVEDFTKAIQLWQNNVKGNPTLATNYIKYFVYLKEKKSILSLDKLQNNLLKSSKRDTFQSDLLIKTYVLYYNYLSEKESWEKALEKALEGVELKDFNLASTKTRIEYLSNLGYIYRQCKNPYEAISFYKKSLDLNMATNGENANIANDYNNLGDAYIENYNPTKANECYKKAIYILEKITTNKPEDIDQLLIGYRNLIGNLLEYGAQEEAKKYVNKINTLFLKNKKQLNIHSKELCFHARQMQIDGNVSFFAATGNFEMATKYCDSLKTETSFKKENIKEVEFLTMRYYDVADFMYEFEEYAQTAERLHQLEPIINKFNLIVPKMLVNAKLGTSYEKLKEYKKALHHIEIAEQIVDQQHFNSSKFSIQIIKAIILGGMNKNQEAIAISKNTLEQLVYEKTKTKIAIDQIKFENVSELADAYFINIFEKVADLYVKKFKLSKQKKDIEIAENLYQIAGKLFQEYYLKGEFNDYLSYYHQEIVEGIFECTLLNQASFQQKIKNINLIERNASQHLLKEFDKKIKRRTSENTTSVNQINNLKIELEFYKKQNTTVKRERDFNSRKIITLQKEIDKLSNKLSETEKNYSKFNTATFDVNKVISRLKNEEQLLKYYVCSNVVYAIMFSNNSIEIKKIGDKKTIENQVKKYSKEIHTIQTNFKKNSNTLYTLLMPFTFKKTITIIPDSFLNYLPFETLYNYKKEAYVIENHLVSYNYSLPMWLLHQQNRQKNYNQSLAAFAPFYDKPSSNNKRSDFKELKFITVESQQIANLFGGTLFTKEKATKDNFIKEIENFDIFHLSMHSQLFEDDFNKSCLVFSNEEKLYFSDLYGMHIPASMVVLSACDTGSGTLKNGEGIMSMSRALTYAGVKSAVVSLWQVPDKETSEIMISFYENLKKGQAKDQALANAKNTFIKNNPMKNHPFYWAGFIVNGDVSPIVNNSYNWIIYISIGILLVALLFIFRKKLLQFRK